MFHLLKNICLGSSLGVILKVFAFGILQRFVRLYHELSGGNLVNRTPLVLNCSGMLSSDGSTFAAAIECRSETLSNPCLNYEIESPCLISLAVAYSYSRPAGAATRGRRNGAYGDIGGKRGIGAY